VNLLSASGDVLPTSQFPVDPTAYNGIAGDFNGDGKLDLAITNFGNGSAGSVSILLGNGDGTFQTARDFAVSGSPAALAAADFNGDGKLDVAVTDESSGLVWVLLGNGDGTLRTPVSYPVGNTPGSMVAADFNGDGTPDLAVLNFGDRNISVLLNNGNGTFRGAINSPGGPSGSRGIGYLVFADLNHDGKMDLAVAYQNNNSISVLLGEGNGAFQPAQNYVTGSQPASMGISPFSDGTFFLFTVDDITQDLLLNFAPGDGTLAMPQLYPAGTSLSSIATADLNGDHNPDVIVYDGASNAVQVLLNGSNGLGAPVAYPIPGGFSATPQPQALAAGDLNGDGVPDVVVANLGSGASGTVSSLLGKGNGTLATAHTYPAASTPIGVVLDDFNGDHKLDAAVVNSGDTTSSTDLGSVSILIGNGDGSFQAPVNYPQGTLHPAAIVSSDLNGDGKPDLIVANTATNGLAPGNIAILINNGNGTFRSGFSSQVGSTPGAPSAIAVKDLNGDGIADLAVAYMGVPNSSGIVGPGGIAIFFGNGDGTFRTGPVAATEDANISEAIAIADINGDGKPDLIVTHCCGQDVTYLLGNGDGTFQAEQHLSSGPSPVAAAITEFAGDTAPDLVIANQGGFVIPLANVFPTIAITPAAPTLSASQSQQFTAQFFFNSSTAVTWSISPQVGTVSASGLYTAPASIATQQTVTVTASNGANFNNTVIALITLMPGGVATTPEPATAGPASGSATTQTFTFTFTDAGGYQNLHVVDVLINNALDGRHACYVAFVPSGASSGSVFLVDDAGDAGGPYSGMVLPGNGTVQNSQCSISGANSSVSGSGNTLTLTLAVTFSASFSGNKVAYLSAQDISSNNSGWQALGTWNVPGSTPAGPWVSGMSPGHSTNAAQTYQFTFTDTNGFRDISVANILVNSAIDGRHACYVAFVPATSSVLLVDDAGDAGGPYSGMVLPGSASVSNSQCSISAAGSSVGGTGNTLTLTLAITFAQSFAGNQLFFLAARNASGQNSNWQAVGSAAIP